MRLFPERVRTEDRTRQTGESMWSYLDRSAVERHDQIRNQLELLVASLPPESRPGIVARLQDRDDRRFNDAISELAVHQALSAAGHSDIEVSPSTADGETDYRISSIGLHFEVTRIGARDQDHGDRQRRYQVLTELNRLDCGRFTLRGTLHSGQQTPSVRRLRTQITAWLASLDPAAERAALEANPSAYRPNRKTFSFGTWSIELSARPLQADAPSESFIATVIERFPYGPVTVASIRKALARKRHQHKNLTEPLVIAVDVSAGAASDCTLAEALYGVRSLVGWSQPADNGALWTPSGGGGTHALIGASGPDVVGVLVLDQLRITSLEAIDATLWLPPSVTDSPVDGPWRTARCRAGADGEIEFVLTEPPEKYLLSFPQ